jgi:hypothetical protein
MSQFDSAVSSHLNKSLKSPIHNSWTQRPRFLETARLDERKETTEFHSELPHLITESNRKIDKVGGDVYNINNITFNPSETLMRTNTIDEMMLSSPVKRKEEQQSLLRQ